MPIKATDSLTLSRTSFLQKIGVPEGLTPFNRSTTSLSMDCRTSLTKLYRTAFEVSSENPKLIDEYLSTISDELLDLLKLTPEQEEALNKLWSDYSKEIRDIVSPTIEAKVEKPDPSFTIENLTDDQWQKVEDSHQTPDFQGDVVKLIPIKD